MMGEGAELASRKASEKVLITAAGNGVVGRGELESIEKSKPVAQEEEIEGVSQINCVTCTCD